MTSVLLKAQGNRYAHVLLMSGETRATFLEGNLAICI